MSKGGSISVTEEYGPLEGGKWPELKQAQQADNAVSWVGDNTRGKGFTNNADYDHDKWYSTPDGSFERRVAAPSVMDSFSGFNYNKIANQPGEYYSPDKVPILKVEWDEEEYYRNWRPTKSAETLKAELDEPKEALMAKYKEYKDKDMELIWTPALQAMTTELPQARNPMYKVSSFFQLNSKGYRKNWANTAICEYRPIQRFVHNNMWFHSDWFWRFHVTKFNVTFRPRLSYFKLFFTAGIMTMIYDHVWAREYRRRKKFH